MKTKKFLLIITALCCTMMSACNKQQDNIGNVSKETTASNAEEKSGESTIIDVFSELNVTFEGTNDHGDIICEYTGNNEFVKEYVKFKCPTDYGDFRNGETAIVKLDFNEFKAEQQNVTFKELEREYTVEGLWGSIVSPYDYDFSDVDDLANSFFTENEKSKYVNRFKNAKQLEKYGRNTFTINSPDGYDGTVNDIADWEVLSVSCEPYAKRLYITQNKDSGTENSYAVFYKISVKGEKTKADGVLYYEDDPNAKYHYGDIKEWTFLGTVSLSNVSVEKNSQKVYAKTDPYFSAVIDSDSEYYNSDFNTFFENYLNETPNGLCYFYDFNSNEPEWTQQ